MTINYPKGKLRLEERSMTVTLTLNEITAEQASEVLDLLRKNKEDAVDEAIKDTAKIPAPARKAKKPVESTEETDPEMFEDVTPTEHTIEEVRAALAKLSKAKGKDAAKEVLTQFDVNKVTELTKDQYAAVLEAVSNA